MSKLLTMLLISIGFFSLEYLLNRVVTHLLDLQEKAFMACLNTPLVVEEGRIKTKWKVCFAILAVVLCIIMGTLFLYCHEKMSFVDSVYLSVISVSTVGYGDKAFETVVGRLFAVFWILASCVSVTSFFYYFAETTIGGSVMMQLQANMMTSESQEDQTGAAEFILAKIRESEKISVGDVTQLLEEYVNMLSESQEDQTGAVDFILAKLRESKKISVGDVKQLLDQYERWRQFP